MTIADMRECADRTLKFFFQTMPDIPFDENDIIFDFAPPTRMFARYKLLCEKYRPREIILKEHEEQLANGTSGQAVIGENKSAVLICTKQQFLKANLRYIIFHELMHIYCAKTEIAGKHFVDIYGSGEPYNNDEALRDGYYIWSEFIADYYADKYTGSGQFSFESVRDDIRQCLYKDIAAGGKDNRRDFEWACLSLLTLFDTESVINRINELDIISGNSTYAKNARRLFDECVQLLYNQIQTEKPWIITGDFIGELGENYLSFESVNTLYWCERMGGIEAAMRGGGNRAQTRNT